MKDITVPALTHELSADTDEPFDPNGAPWDISGVAVAPGDVLRMDDGTPVLMTEDELRKAAPTQADEPLSVDHPTDGDGEYAYPPPSDATAGTVAAAGYVDGGPNRRGVGYNATVHDPDIARGMHGGTYEVSVHPQFELGERDPDTGAYVAESIQFRDLSVVSKGDSESNTANWGASAELAAWANQTDIGAELAASTDASADGTGDSAPQSLVSSAVNGTLRALGIEPGDAPTDAASLAAGDADTDDNGDTDTMTDRDQQVTTLVENHGFDAETLDSWDDDQIETTHSTLVDSGGDPDDETDDSDAGGADGETTNTDDPDTENVVEVDIGDHDSMDEYIAEQAEQAVASASEESDREELIADITDATDEHDAEALAEWPTDALEDKAESVTATARLPGTTGRHTETVAASHSDSESDTVGEYGTGVAEH